MTNNMVSKKIKDILNATPVNVMCTKRMSCKAQKILIFQSEEMSILFKEMVFEALCIIWDVSHSLHLNLRMHHTNIRGQFSDMTIS